MESKHLTLIKVRSEPTSVLSKQKYTSMGEKMLVEQPLLSMHMWF